MLRSTADRDLLFGILALQIGLIDQDQLLAAFRAWSRDKACPLADYLADRDGLDADDRAVVDVLVARQLKKHDGDIDKSLAAIPADRSTRDRLAQIDGPSFEATFGCVGAGSGSASSQSDRDPDHTASYAVGSATSASSGHTPRGASAW
jgi:eukaryotic-like serine/threonine-protein kinase